MQRIFFLKLHSPWETRAVTFVLGLGLGALLRMFIVLGIVLIRGRRACRAGRRCGARRGLCRRRLAQDPELDGTTAVLGPAPPAYSDMIDEKPKVVDVVPVMSEAPKEAIKEVLTVAIGDSGDLEVWWTA